MKGNLGPDVAVAFPSSQAVNEALRFLMRVTKENAPVPNLYTRIAKGQV